MSPDTSGVCYRLSRRMQRKLKALVDPQTSGGLLASVPENLARDCLRKLQEVQEPRCLDCIGNVGDSAERAIEP